MITHTDKCSHYCLSNCSITWLKISSLNLSCFLFLTNTFYSMRNLHLLSEKMQLHILKGCAVQLLDKGAL